MKVAVVGAGHVGLVTGLVLWENGHDVVFVDHDPDRVAALAWGKAPFHEPGLGELLGRATAARNVSFTGETGAVLECEVALLCVPTPSGADGALDTTFLAGATTAIGVAIEARGDAGRLSVVLVRSTVVPGTTRRVVASALSGVDVGTLPEFLREGSALEDARRADRVVIGGDGPHVRAVARALYPGAPVVEMTLESAELVKYGSNSLLALCISFSNELARIAEHLPGVDARAVLDAVTRDRRLATGETRAGIAAYLEPGPGFGGSCLAKDVRALAALARSEHEATPLLDGILSINASQPARFVDRLMRAIGDGACRVLVLGLAFKPDTDDVRESTAFAVVAALEARGAVVRCHDPVATAGFFAARSGPATGVTDWRAAAHDVDAIVVLTGWTEYLADLPALLAHRPTPVVLGDPRGLLGVDLPPLVKCVGVGHGDP